MGRTAKGCSWETSDQAHCGAHSSWNDGAGASRVYTLAGIIRYTMIPLDPGSLTDEEAQQLAAYINSQPRPSYPFKDQDYLVEPLPADAVYYPPRVASR